MPLSECQTVLGELCPSLQEARKGQKGDEHASPLCTFFAMRGRKPTAEVVKPPFMLTSCWILKSLQRIVRLKARDRSAAEAPHLQELPRSHLWIHARGPVMVLWIAGLESDIPRT